MPSIGDVAEILQRFAPVSLAEDWDNVGLLVGEKSWPASRIMTCLTVTPATVAEAIDQQAQLIVTHHPLPFRPLKSLTDATTPGRMLLQLVAAGIGVYSPHTAFDSAPAGINQHLAIGMGLQQIEPLVAMDGAIDPDVGAGRFGSVGESLTLLEMAERVKSFLNVDSLQIVGREDQAVSRVAIACGSAGQFLPQALAAGCQLFVTGEASFHTCLEAEANQIGLLLLGHFASERFAVVDLATELSQQFPQLTVWASRSETDPINVV